MNNTGAEQLVGQVTHFFGKLGVAIVKLSKPVKSGENLHFKGVTTDFMQSLTSMEVAHQVIDEASIGDEIGMKVDEKVREGDMVYTVE